MSHSPARLHSQQGTVLFTAVIALMILAVTSLSFVALAGFEIRIGMNHREGLEALNLAESAIQHGRSLIMASTALNFTSWVNSADNGMVLLNALTGPGGGTYSVRIDNNCSANVMGPSLTADTDCATNTDGDRTAIMTAWATSGTGRARIRIWLQSTDAWKHTCYDGDGTLCTDGSNGDIFPSDPEDPNGPATGPMPLPTTFECGAALRTPPGVVFTTTECVIQPYYNRALAGACTRLPCNAPRSARSPWRHDRCGLHGSLGDHNEALAARPVRPGLLTALWLNRWPRTADVLFKSSQAGGHADLRWPATTKTRSYSALNPAHPSPHHRHTHDDCPHASNVGTIVLRDGKGKHRQWRRSQRHPGGSRRRQRGS